MKYLRCLAAVLVLLSALYFMAAKPLVVHAAPGFETEESAEYLPDETADAADAIDEDAGNAEDAGEADEFIEPEFIPRTYAPSYYNEYYFSRANLYYASGYGMPNCTAYAFGRAYEILDAEPKLSIRDAGCWWYDNIASHAYDYGKEPRLGAVACWDNYDESTGHVSVVEEIREDGSVLLSESSWSGYLFDTFEIDKDGNCKYTSSMRFLGYIYIDKPLAGDGTLILSVSNSGTALHRSQISKDILAEESAEEISMPEES